MKNKLMLTMLCLFSIAQIGVVVAHGNKQGNGQSSSAKSGCKTCSGCKSGKGCKS